MNGYNEEEEDGPLPSFLRPPNRGHNTGFDPSPAREDDIRRCMAACANGRETITPSGARQVAEIAERRSKYLHYYERAKARKLAKGKA
jgi:hypothetical protein